MANKKSVKTTKTKKSTGAKRTTKSVKKVQEFKLFDKSTYWCVGFIVAVIAIVGCVFSLYKSYGSYSRPDYEASAIVYHSESQGIDAGTEYIYSIYKNKDSDTYFYIKSKASITMTGSGTATDVKSGSIKKKSDLNKITTDIEKDVESNAQKVVTYTFVDNSTKVEVKDITELGNKLFK